MDYSVRYCGDKQKATSARTVKELGIPEFWIQESIPAEDPQGDYSSQIQLTFDKPPKDK
jgi:hypothetical protein